MDKLRFLAASDFHSDIKLIEKIEKELKKNPIDFVIITGDLSEKKDDFAKLLNVFNGKQIFMVPGNHETKKQLQILQDKYNVHLIGNNPVLVHDSLAIFGCNYLSIGQASIYEEDILFNLIENFNSVKDVKHKIFLSHIPPHGTKIGDASPYFPFIGGSAAVREFLDNFEPQLAFVGHIHETSGLEEIVNKTKVINVARTFKIFEFDPKKNLITQIKSK